jgi:hypothetical protein
MQHKQVWAANLRAHGPIDVLCQVRCQRSVVAASARPNPSLRQWRWRGCWCRQRAVHVGKADSHPSPAFPQISSATTTIRSIASSILRTHSITSYTRTPLPTTPYAEPLPPPANSTRCLSVLSIPAARSPAAPHAISMTAPNAAQWCVREDERLPLCMALERNVRIARLEGPRTASPP